MSTFRSLAAKSAVVLVFAALTAGCADWQLLSDPGSGLAYGDDGTYATVLKSVSLRIRQDESVPVDLVVPASTETEQPVAGRFSPVLILQGGLVDTARYHWLAAHIASRGHFVIMAHHVGGLAFFEQSNALDALYAARAQAATAETGDFITMSEDAPALVTGHSLGAVVASKVWLAGGDDVDRLVLLAGIPDGADDNAAKTSGRVLAIAGGTDTRIGPDAIREDIALYAAPTSGVVVEGFNHFGFVDDNTDANRESDGPLEIDLEDGRRRVQFFMDASLARDDTALADRAQWPQGVSPL